jgi:PAS domain S-box-containing protein
MKKKPTYEELKQKIQDFDKKMDLNAQTEKGLRRDNHNLTTLLDNIPGCIALILKKGNREIVASNKFAKELGAIPGLTCFKTCSMLDNNCPWCLAPKLWETGQSQKIEIENKGKWYEGIWEPLTEDLYVHYIFDITERKFVEEEAKRNELKFKLAMETIKDVFWISTYGVGKMVYISPAYEVLWETDCANLYMSPKSFLEKIHPEDLNAYQETIEKYHAKGFSYESEYRIVKKNGDIAWIHEKGYPIVEEFDSQKLMTGTCSEITAQKFTQNLTQAQLELSFELGRVDTLENGMNSCLEAALLVSDLDCGGIYIVDKKSGNFDLVFHKGLSKSFVQDTSCFEKESDNATLVMMGNPIYTKHQQLEIFLTDSEKKENLRALAILPIKYQNQVIGCLNIASHNKDDIPNLSRIALETISNQIGSSITYLNTRITLRDSEDTLNLIFELTPDLIGVVDVNEGRFKQINPAWEEVFGYSIDEFLSKPFMSFVHPDDQNATAQEVDYQISGKPVHEFVNRYRCKDGSYRVIEWHSTPAQVDGTVYATGRDITKRKRVEDALVESEKRFSTIFRTNPAAIALTRLSDNRLVEVNDAWQELIGYTNAEIVDRTPFELNLYVESAQRERLLEMLRKQGTARGEMKARRKSGEICHVLMSAEIIELAEESYLLSMCQDITNRKQTEEKLRENEEKYRTLFERESDAIFIYDPDTTNIFDANEATSKMYGYSHDELIGMSCLKFSAEVKKSASTIDIIRKDEKIKIQHRLHCKKDGIVFPVDISGYAITLKGKKMMYAVCKDITKRKQAEDNLLKNQYYLTKAQEIGKIGTWELDIQKNILIWTDENYKIFGVPLGTGLTYEIFLNRIHPDDRDYVNKKWNAALNNEPYDIMHRLIVDDKVKWVREKADIKFDEEGNAKIAIGFTQDLTGLKQIENALQESEEKFKVMFERAPLSCQSLDEDGNFTEVNQTWIETMGYERGEVLGKNFSEFLHPDWKNHFKENFPQFKAVDEVLGIEFEMVKKDGSRILVSFHGKIGKDKNDNFQQTHCIFQDITTSKMLQEESEKNKTILLEAEKLAGFGGWQWDIGNNSWTLSQNWLKIHGCSNRHLETEELIKIAHPEDIPKIQNAFDRVVKNGGSFDIEYRIIHQTTGEIKHIHAYGEAQLDGSGKIEKMFGAAQDITEQKKTEESSKRLKERLESLWNITKVADSDIKTISDHVLAEVQKMTQSKYAFYGFIDDSENEMKLHAWSNETMDNCKIDEKILHFAINKAGIWAEAVKEKKILTINDFHLDHPGKTGVPDGHVQLTRLMVVPLIKGDKVISIVAVANKPNKYSEEDGKQVEAFMGNVQLLIDRKKSEQEKIELLTQLQQLQKIESIGNLAGGIAHDFNNLLFPIIGMSEMLMEDFPADSPEYQDANEIFKAGKRGSELVMQILSFSRRHEHKLMPVRVQKIMKEVLKLTRATIPSSIEIQINIQQNCGMVLADPTQLHQVGMNLLTNAYQAIESASGKINIGLKQVIINKSEPLQSSLPPGEYVQLLVADNGTGMSPSVIDKIFEPYFTTKARRKGTGLGLAVVYGIIKEHKGDILVTSHEGKGTSFKIYLPLIPKKESMNNPSIHEFELIKGNERILILDDEKTIVNTIRKVLTRLGYKVTGYTNSQEALIKFKSDPDHFDLIISDMTMPEMTGDEFASEILSIRPEIPIIICTGFSERIDKERAESIGVQGFLMKPVLKSEMAYLVRKLLDGSGGNLRT